MSVTEKPEAPPVQGGWLKTPEPGFYYDVAAETYHRWDAMSNSWLRVLVDECPQVFNWQRAHPKPTTAAMEFGTLLHTLVCEPFDFASRYAVAPEVDRRTKAGKQQWADFNVLAQSREVVTKGDYTAASEMAKAIQSHPTAMRYLQGGRSEVSIVWDDPELKIRCKARLDHWHESAVIVADLKSAANVKPEVFEATSLINYGYYMQGAFYSDGIRALTGKEPVFVIVAVGKSPPYPVIARPLDPIMAIPAGRMAYKRALHEYRQCLESGQWPGYDGPNGSQDALMVPNWLLKQEGLVA